MYFVTQNPADVPDRVLGQLGNQVQHALQAFSPGPEGREGCRRDHADNPDPEQAEAITELGVGGLVSMLDEKGRPSVVQRTFIVPTGNQISPINEAEQRRLA